MSSEISIDRGAKGPPESDQLQPWQLFTLAGLAGATAVVFVTRDGGPAAVILLSLTVGAASFAGAAAWRMLAPLAGLKDKETPGLLGGRTRAALEREKTLVLRSIKDLEFDRAMGKVSERDFAEMSGRLRVRAAGLIRQLDRGTGYRDAIEQEIARRVGGVVSSPSTRPRCDACGTLSDADARFCKNCGLKLSS